MARLTGNDSDIAHWQQLVRRDPEHIRLMFDQRWEMNKVPNFFLAPENRMLMTNGFWAMRSRHFPKEYARHMVDTWALDREKGFYGDFFPLAMAKESMKTFATDVDHSFGYTPDTAYFTLDGMFCQGLSETASELTLNHLANYNWHTEWNVPVAPEAYERDLTLFGDQYSLTNNSRSAPPCPKRGTGWKSVSLSLASGQKFATARTMSRLPEVLFLSKFGSNPACQLKPWRKRVE
jgi:hypothetical protein